MVNLTINGKAITAREGMSILAAAKENGIRIPTLCYFKDISEVGACRICVVEVKGEKKLLAACNTAVTEGMEVLTDSPRVLAARRVNLQLILSGHNCSCPTCKRNGSCALQSLCEELNIHTLPYETKVNTKDCIKNTPLLRDSTKCIGCLRCVNVCEKIQNIGVWQLLGSGSHAKVTVKGGMTLNEAGCSLCGQCITRCPVGALTERDDTEKAWKLLSDPEKITVIQIAPAVRAAWGDALELAPAVATEKRMAAAAKALGAKYVFDTNFTADLTIMEEGSEFIERMKNRGESKMPMFTSCCPGWVRFVKMHYPALSDHLSTAKSPQQMFGAVAKTYFAEKLGVTADKITCISVMPCTAKKYECDVNEVNATGKDVDLVLTTREFARMIRVKGIDAANLPEAEFDSPLGTGSGAAVIFGATGGVMEAALRSAYYLLTGKNPGADDFKSVRAEGNNGIRVLTAEIGGVTVRAAVASGLGNARVLCEEAVSGNSPYDFIEIMACPGGCAGGGGQPIKDGEEQAGERGERLYAIDKNNAIRFSHENPEVQALYRDYLGQPLSHKSHELLHTEQSKWSI